MKRTLMTAILTAASLAISGLAIAQDDDHGYITVRATSVKPGHADEYREMLGKLASARKAKGHTGVSVFQSVRGPASMVYTVTAHDTMAEVGQPFDSGMSDEDWQQWVGKVTSIIDSSQLTTLQTHRDLAITPPEGSEANLVVLRTRVLKPGKNGAYHDLVEERLRPALQAGGSRGWNISRVVMGDNPNTWITASRVETWEQLDQPGVLADMDAEEREALFDAMNGMSVSNRTELVQHIPELSY